MNNSLVLTEALSVPNIIQEFSRIDKNPYKEIANLVSQKKIKCQLYEESH